jgi:Trypsin-like peptidase domain
LIPILVLLALFVPIPTVLAQPADAPPGEKLAYRFRDLTVQVTSYHDSDPNNVATEGYGFVVGQHDDVATIATADHVVRDPDGEEFGQVRVEFYSDRGHPVTAHLLELRMPAPYGDFALLEVTKPGFRVASFQIAPLPLAQGTRAWRIGKQRGWTPGNLPGVFIGTERTIWLSFDNLDTPRGSSGGPIFVEQGLVGMVTDDQSGRALVLPINIIANFIKEQGQPWKLGEMQSANQDPSVANHVITIWKIGSPYDGGIPDATVPPNLGSLARKNGLEFAVTALSARDLYNKFNDAVLRHEEPDILSIINWGSMTGTKTSLGQFEGLAGSPGVTDRLTLVYKAFEEVTAPREYGWQFLVSGSRNAEAARSLALRDPECDPSWTTGMGFGEMKQMASEAASVFLTSGGSELTRLADPDFVDLRLKPTVLPQPFDLERSPLKVTGITHCSYWGNNRLRFGILALRFETAKMIGNTPVLLILRNENQRWRVLGATEDRLTVYQFATALAGLHLRDAPTALPRGGPVAATLISPDAGQSPQPSSGQRFGDYVWRPSASEDVVAEIAEFASPFGSRLFLRKRDGHPGATDSVSAGQLYSGRWTWRIWSIANSGIITFSDKR